MNKLLSWMKRVASNSGFMSPMPVPRAPSWPVPEITLADRQREILNEGGAELDAMSNIASGYGEAVYQLYKAGKLELEIKRGAFPAEDRFIYRVPRPRA